MVVYMALATASEQHVRVFALSLCRVAMALPSAWSLVRPSTRHQRVCLRKKTCRVYTHTAASSPARFEPYLNTESTIGVIRLLISNFETGW